MDTLDNRIIKRYFDAMLKTAENMTVKEYAEALELSMGGSRERIKRGIGYIAEATDGDPQNLEPGYVFKRIVELHSVSYRLFDLKIREYVENQDKLIWERVPHEGELPTSEELIAYLIDRYRENILEAIGSNTP